MVEKLRIGVLMDTPLFRAWEWRLLKRIAESDYAELVVIVLDKGAVIGTSPALRPYVRIATLLQGAYRYLERNFQCEPDALSYIDDVRRLDDIPRIEIKGIEDKDGRYFDDKDLERIKEHRLDVLVCLTLRIFKGGLLHAARYGTWALRQGEGRFDPDRPVGFWEVYLDRPVIESAVHMLTDDPDRPRVIGRSYSATNRISVKLTNNNLYWKTLSLLPRALAELHRAREPYSFLEAQRENSANGAIDDRSYGFPNNLQLAGHVARNVLWRLKGSFLERFTLEQWILLFDLRKARSNDVSSFGKIIPPRDRYWADPHIIRRNDDYYVFIEEITFASNKGHISVLTLDKYGGHSSPASVLNRDYHLSYPFVLEHAGEHFMIPESSANRTVELYRCMDFPLRWEFVENLLQNVYAVDSTILYHDNKWWLFTNLIENPGASSHDELFLFYSDSLVGGNWTPHICNPIVSDVRRARPAGAIFAEDGKLLRPSQDCSIRYGYGIRVNQITALSENSYRERQIEFLEPPPNGGVFATHTLAYVPGLTIVDGLQRRLKVPF